MKALLSSSMGRQSPSFAQRMEAKRLEEEEERKRRNRNTSAPTSHGSLSSSYNGSGLRSFLYSPPSVSLATPPIEDEEEEPAAGSTVLIEGFLTKQGQRFKTWKRRWCVVLADRRPSSSGGDSPANDESNVDDGSSSDRARKAKLYYAKQPQSRNPRGEVTLDQFSVLDISSTSLLAEGEAVDLQVKDLMPTSHCFCVNTRKRVYYFCCDTADDLARWQRALESLQPGRGHHAGGGGSVGGSSGGDDTKVGGGGSRREPRLERDVRRMYRDLCARLLAADDDRRRRRHQHDDGGGEAKESRPDAAVAAAVEGEGAGRVSHAWKAKEAQPEDGDEVGDNENGTENGNGSEDKQAAEDRAWLQVVEAEIRQAETIDDEEERRVEWARLRQVLVKAMERALLQADQQRAERTLRAAALRASALAVDCRNDSLGESPTTKNEKSVEKERSGDRQQPEEDDGSGTGRRRAGGGRRGGDDEDDDGWNSDGFDTSREPTMVRQFRGRRSDNEEEEDEGEGRRRGRRQAEAESSENTEDEEDELLSPGGTRRKSSSAKRKRRSGRRKAPTRRVYSYGQETASAGFEGEPETDPSFAGGRAAGVAAGTNTFNYGSYNHYAHQRGLDATPARSSFWSCFCC